MKKKYYCAMALATLLTGACSDDTDLGKGGTPDGGFTTADGRTELKFVLGGLGGGVVSYGAAPVVPGENELKTLDIFVFGKDTLPDGTEKQDGQLLLEEVFRSDAGGKITLETNGTTATAKISLLGKNRKRLYFVANGRSQDVFNRFVVGKTDTTAFAAGLANKLNGHISRPLLMTTDYAINIADSIAQKGEGNWKNSIDVTLKRRMARFDVVNSSVDSRFYIEWVQLVNPRSQAYLFDDVTDHKTEADADYWTKLTDIWSTSERIDFKSVDNANNGDALAAFYTYPEPKESASFNEATDFYVVLGGRSGADGTGDPVLYPVKIRTDQKDEATAMTIDANHRYVISLASQGNNLITATIKVLDWAVADTLIEHAGYGTFGLSAPAATGLMTENTLTLAGNEVKANWLLNVAASTEWTAEVVTGNDWLAVTAPAAGSVDKKLTFSTTAVNPDSEKTRTGTIIFRNVMRPSITQTLLVVQPVNASGQHLNVGEPKGITGLSIEGDTIVLPGYDALAMSVPVTCTDGTVAVTNDNNDMFATIAMNAENNAVVVTMKENKTGKARRGVVTLTSENNLIRKIAIRQMPMALGVIRLQSGLIADKAIQVNATGLTATKIDVLADSEWEFDGQSGNPSFDVEGWLHITEITGATGNGSFKIAADANTTFAARSTSVKLVNKQKPASIYYVLTIKQAANAETIAFGAMSGTSTSTTEAIFANDVLTIANDETATFTIAVDASLNASEWEVGAITGNTGDWLTISKETGGLQIVTTANSTPGDPAREATITVQKAGDSSISKTVTVKQAAAEPSVP